MIHSCEISKSGAKRPKSKINDGTVRLLRLNLKGHRLILIQLSYHTGVSEVDDFSLESMIYNQGAGDAPSIAGAVNPHLQFESASSCVNPHEKSPPATPPHIRKWRKSNFIEPGKRCIHPGMQDDFSDGINPNKIFGTGTSSESDHVEDVWKNPEGDTVFQQTKVRCTEGLRWGEEKGTGCVKEIPLFRVSIV